MAKLHRPYQALPNMAALTIRQAAQDGQKPSIIAIMGCTGVGKSTFVKTIGAVSLEIDAKGPVVGDGLESCKSYLLRPVQG